MLDQHESNESRQWTPTSLIQISMMNLQPKLNLLSKQWMNACLQSWKSTTWLIFSREPPKLIKAGNAKLCFIRLLTKGRGNCHKFNVMLNLVACSRGDGLLWKCTKCKKCQKSMRNKSMFTNRKLSLHQLLVIIFQFVSKAKVKVLFPF